MDSLPPMAKTLARPLSFWIVYLVSLALMITSGALGIDPLYSIGNFAGIGSVILILWHFTYLAMVMGSPSALRQQLAPGMFVTVVVLLLLPDTFADDTALVVLIEPVVVLAICLLVGLAATGLARVFGQGSALAIAGYVFIVWFAPIAGLFYFQRAHDAGGQPRRAQVDFAPVQSYPSPERNRAEDYIAFWQTFRRETGEDSEAPRNVDAFGDSEAMQDELLALVLNGTKQATASLARHYADWELPEVGDLTLITDGRGAPACVIRTSRVDIIPVREVDAEFAWVEGEGDRSYEYWITEHRKFWSREAEREGFEYSDDLDVVCERFELAWAPPR